LDSTIVVAQAPISAVTWAWGMGRQPVGKTFSLAGPWQGAEACAWPPSAGHAEVSMHVPLTPVVVRKQEVPLPTSEVAFGAVRSEGELVPVCNVTAPDSVTEGFDSSCLGSAPTPAAALDAPLLAMEDSSDDDAIASLTDQPSSAPVPVAARTRRMP
jgi:hypothetical protein